MGYTALYRKFRPINFNETVGQEHITKTLKNQIIANRVGHAYLLNGGRGTGKTSTAKILARAINCINPQQGEPCNKCEICLESMNGSLTDIVEMDAASNNSVEDIRAIRDEVNFLPTKAKYRIYIIDEVHMLSSGAFNALLKTLEEPPEHVKFILATTEPQKLPATILSRCQRFDFKQISVQNIVKRLEIVCKESNILITPKALEIIAVLAEGALRDALSILERCAQDGDNNIGEDKVKELVGIPKIIFIHNITKAIIDYNIDEATQLASEILAEGKDINNILWEIIKYVKDILVYKVTQKLQIYSEEEKEKIKELSINTSKDRLLELVYKLSELENNIKISTQKNIMFEAGIIKLCIKKDLVKIEVTSGKNDTPIENKELNERVEKIENYLRNLSNGKKVSKVQETVIEKKVPTFSNKTAEFWPQILKNLKDNGKMQLYTYLSGTQAEELSDMTIGINFNKPICKFTKDKLEAYENIKEVSNLVSMACGKPMEIKYIGKEIASDRQDYANDLAKLAQDADIPFNIV